MAPATDGPFERTTADRTESAEGRAQGASEEVRGQPRATVEDPGSWRATWPATAKATRRPGRP
jgi:hypothetical protein